MGRKIFGIQFGEKTQTPETSNYSLMTDWLGAAGYELGNLTNPFTNEGYIHRNGYVPFGDNNLYPQELAAMYLGSSLHHAIVDFKVASVSGNGYALNWLDGQESVKEKIYQAQLERMFKKNYNQLTFDLVLHNRMYLRVSFDSMCKLKSLKRVDPVMVRHEQGNMYGEVTKAYVSPYWQSTNKYEVLPILEHKSKGMTTDYIYMYKGPSVLSQTYTTPAYASASNWMYLDGEISFLHKSNIDNSINPSFILNFPRKPANKEEMEKLKDSINSKGKGAKNAGRIITLFSQTKDQMPEVITATASQNDKLFLQTSRELRDSICFAHNINPALVGIKVAGSLGNASELKTSYNIFSTTVINPIRGIVEDYFDDLIDISGAKGKFTLIPVEYTYE